MTMDSPLLAWLLAHEHHRLAFERENGGTSAFRCISRHDADADPHDLRHQLAPEPSRNLRPACQGCGGPHPFDTSIASPLWTRVIRDAGLPDYLCTTCIVLAFVRAGESFAAELYGGAVNRPDRTAPIIRVQVDDRPLDESYGHLQAQLREADGRLVEALRAYEQDLTIGSGASIRGIGILVDADRVAALLKGRPR